MSTKKNRLQLLNLLNSLIPDNSNRLISASVVRRIIWEVISSVFNLEEDTFPVVRGNIERLGQDGHGFTAPMAIRETGTQWVKSIAQYDTTLESSEQAEVYGIVTRIIDDNTFEMCNGGAFDSTGLGLQPGKVYFLSPSTAGGLTLTPPSLENQIVKALVLGGRNNVAYFVNFVGEVLGSGGVSNPGDGGVDFGDFIDDLEDKLSRTTDKATIEDLGADKWVSGELLNSILSGLSLVSEFQPAESDNTANVGFFATLLDEEGYIDLKEFADRVVSRIKGETANVNNNATIRRWQQINRFTNAAGVQVFYFPPKDGQYLSQTQIFTGDNNPASSNPAGHGTGGKVLFRALADGSETSWDDLVMEGQTAEIVNVAGLDYFELQLDIYQMYTIFAQAGGGVLRVVPVSAADKLSKTSDDTADGVITFKQTIISDTEDSTVIEKTAWDDIVNEETHRKITLNLVNRATKEINVVVDTAEDLASVNFSDPDGGNQAGITFGVGGETGSNTYKGVNIYYSRGGALTGSIRLYIRENLTFLNAFFSRAASQKIGSIPNVEGALSITSGSVTLDLGAFTLGRGALLINQNISFEIANQEDGHHYIVSATTDSTIRTITLPANSVWYGNVASLSLAASSKFKIEVRARLVSGTWNYEWEINKFN